MIHSILIALGRSDRLEAMRRGFTSKSEPGSGVWTGMLVLVIIGVVVIIGLLILNRVQGGREASHKNSAGNLFRDVLGELSLGLNDRALLRRVVKELKLAQPASMLLTPKLFAEAAYGYLTAKEGKAGADMQRLETICQQLFGQPIPEPPPPTETKKRRPSRGRAR